MSIRQAAKLTDMTTEHIRRLCKRGILQATFDGCRYEIDPASLQEYAESRKAAPEYAPASQN